MKALQTGSLRIGSTEIPFRVTRSRRRRRTIALAIEADTGLTVMAPVDTSFETIEALAHRRATWIIRKLEDVKAAAARRSPREFVSGETIRYLGRCYRLRVIESEQAERSCKLVGGWLEVTTRPEPNPNRQRAVIASRISAWYRTQAKARLKERLSFWSERYGFGFSSLIISSPAKRWGSCDPDNNIRINWRVMMVPSSLIDYVVAHELAHVIHKNHSEDFWRLLGSVMPDYDRRRQELIRVGGNLDI